MTTKMLPITTITLLLLCQHLSITLSTRLPLEVYELTSATTSAAHDLRYLQQQQLHKNLEYDTLSVDEAAELLEQQQQQQHQHQLPNVTQPAVTLAVKSASDTTSNEHSSSSQVLAASVQQQLDRRRSRQMLDLLQQKHQHQQQQQEQQQQQQQQQHHLHHQHQTRNFKDIRILYQVGESEEDLPICALNAVCSKIDLYETPWIERQCRCPESNHHHQPHVILHHHNSNTNNNNHNNKDTSLDTNSYTHILSHNSNNDKYRSYYEQEKLLQHKRLLVSGDFVGDKRFESLHLKKLMQKLGAVYQDDLDLHPGDFLETNEDTAGIHPDEIDLEVLSENEFPHAPPPSPSRRKMHHQQHATTTTTLSSAHMRHSGHGNHAKEISYIGGCPSGLGIEDGHTIADKTRHYKMCSPVHKLPVCKHFRDYTWTLTTSAELNVTEQIVHCRCPKNSVTYLTKREPAMDGSGGFNYLFACSPLTRIRCQRKQPCKLFTVRKRQEFLDEVNINALCQCPKGHHCPSHHTQGGVIPGESFLEDNIQTYSGYCMVND